MSLLLAHPNHLEAVLAVFELVLVRALLNVVLEEFRDFDILRAVLAVGDILALLGKMEVIEVFVLELRAVGAAELADRIALLRRLFLSYLGHLLVDTSLHGHQDHRVQLLEVL